MRSSLMMSLLRILTPEEINELTTTSEGNKRVPLTQLMYRKMGVATEEEIESASLAKILPFTFPEKESDEDSVHEASDQIEKVEQGEHELEAGPESEHGQIGVHEEALASNGRLPTSVFILHEKKRLEANVHKMRSKELLKSYRKNASLDIEQEKGLRDDMKKSSRSGVLVNKKHA